MILFDLDGVLRDLCGAITKEPVTEWNPLINGVSFMDAVNSDLNVLATAPPTIYHQFVSRLSHVHLLTSQPKRWRFFTQQWISKNFLPCNNVSVTYVDHPREKLALLSDSDILVEDYPYFTDYSKILLIDHPYNRHVKNPIERITTPGQLARALYWKNKEASCSKKTSSM